MSAELDNLVALGELQRQPPLHSYRSPSDKRTAGTLRAAPMYGLLA